MRMSQTVGNIMPALLKAQSLMGAAKKGSANPYFKSKYADLGAVLEACKELLNDNGITILQPHYTNVAGDFVETYLIHSSGEYVSSETRVVAKEANNPQALGSAITYARRYGLQSLLSMPAEDDDGETAMERNPGRKPAAQAPAESPRQTVAAPKTPPKPAAGDTQAKRELAIATAQAVVARKKMSKEQIIDKFGKGAASVSDLVASLNEQGVDDMVAQLQAALK